MGWTGVVLALTLPWLAGTLWLRLLWWQPQPGRWPLILGYGYLFGMLGVALFLIPLGELGWRLHAGPPLALSALGVALALWQLRRLGRLGSRIGLARSRPNRGDWPNWRVAAFALLLLWLMIRLLGLGLEVWWRPLSPWDAWTTWAMRARVWSELRELAPFVSPQAWLAQPEAVLHTIPAWTYPRTLSLIAAWPSLALGAWNETAANLPWLGAAIALGLGAYGQSRLWGASPLTALILTWLILSLPLLDSQVALAGYGDLWVAFALGLGFMAFLHWARDGEPRQALLALLALGGCATLKNEGLAWVAIFVPALVAARLGWRWLLALGLTAFGLVAWIYAQGGLEFELPGLGPLRVGPDRVLIPLIGSFSFAYHAPWEPVLRHTFLYSNWHLFPYLLMLALAVATARLWRRPGPGWRLAGLTWVLASLGALYILFFWTEAYLWAVQATSFNRLVLHFAPALLFWMLTLWLDLGTSNGLAAVAKPRSGMPPASASPAGNGLPSARAKTSDRG